MMFILQWIAVLALASGCSDAPAPESNRPRDGGELADGEATTACRDDTDCPSSQVCRFTGVGEFQVKVCVCRGTTELCNGSDDDCDGAIDEACPGDGGDDADAGAIIDAGGSDTGVVVIGRDAGLCDGDSPPLSSATNPDHDCNRVLNDGPLCRPLLYVDGAASGRNTGDSWADAYVDLQTALDDASACLDGTEIWVREGTYRPTRPRTLGAPRTATFMVRGKTRLIGGFAGTESTPCERDSRLHPTILSGDLGVANDRADNAHVVLMLAACPRPALVLEDVEITAGDGTGQFNNVGSGAHLEGGGPHVFRNVLVRDSAGHRSPAVKVNLVEDMRFEACRFEDNTIRNGGIGSSDPAGLLTGGSDVVIEGCTFRNNRGEGSGVSASLEEGTLVVRDSAFVDNVTQYGSAGLKVGGRGMITIERCRFEGNRVEPSGPGSGAGSALSLMNVREGPVLIRECDFIHNSGRVATVEIAGSHDPTVRFERCRLLGNTSTHGFSGGIHSHRAKLTVDHSLFSGNLGSALTLQGTFTSESVLVTNTTIANNTSESGAAIYLYGPEWDVASSVQVRNSILWGNRNAARTGEQAQIYVDPASGTTVAVDHTILEATAGTFGTDGVVSADPNFVAPLGDDGSAGTTDDDLRLGDGSPAVDAGRLDAMCRDDFDADSDGDLLEAVPFDLVRAPSVVGGAPDLGCFERP